MADDLLPLSPPGSAETPTQPRGSPPSRPSPQPPEAPPLPPVDPSAQTPLGDLPLDDKPQSAVITLRGYPHYLTPHYAVHQARLSATVGALYGLAEAAYPPAWIEDRLRSLYEMLEKIRTAAGTPVEILGCYFPAACEGCCHPAHSAEHGEGRAAHIVAYGLLARELEEVVLGLHEQGALPELGGLGWYPTYVHVDMRPHERGALVRWDG